MFDKNLKFGYPTEAYLSKKDMQDEIWKDIVGFEGYYKISTHGRIKSCERLVLSKMNSLRKISEKIYTPFAHHGYLRKKLRIGKFYKTFFVHRLVGTAFCNGYKDGLQINHKDGCKINNHYLNLEWTTGSENVKHSFRTGLKTSHLLGKKGLRSPASRPLAKKSLLTNEILEIFDSAISASKSVGVSPQAIGSVALNPKRKSSAGFAWSFISKEEFFLLMKKF